MVAKEAGIFLHTPLTAAVKPPPPVSPAALSRYLVTPHCAGSALLPSANTVAIVSYPAAAVSGGGTVTRSLNVTTLTLHSEAHTSTTTDSVYYIPFQPKMNIKCKDNGMRLMHNAHEFSP